MSSEPPLKPRKRDELARARRRQPFQGKERLRLVFMAGGLIAVIGIFIWLRIGLQKEGDPNKVPKTITQIGSDIQFPPVDLSIFEDVKDATNTDRVLLSSGPFEELLQISRALLPGHLDALESPRIPFDAIEQNSATLRGVPFRDRGKLLDLKIQQRVIDGPEETWALVETDEGKRYWFATLKQPEELFGTGGNFVVTDGFFYKLFTQSLDGERVTAPLLVGREIRPSVRRAEPAKQLDLGTLADVRDSDFYEKRPIEDAGYWHLMNFVETLQTEPDRIATEFERAEPLSRNTIKDLVAQPSLKRGRPYLIYGRTVHAWNKANEENPTRLPFSSHSFLFKYELGDQYLRLVAPGSDSLNDIDLGTEMLAYFHKMWAYTDGNNQERRVPVFFVASFAEREIDKAPLEGQIVIAFIALFVVMLLGFTFLIRRDRKQAEAAAEGLRARRQRMRERS